MMNNSDKTGFSRKVVAYYLFFCMVAVTWLSLGVMTTAQRVLSCRTTSNCLSRLGQLASALEMDSLRNEGRGIQQMLKKAQDEGRFAYCSIVGADGRYLAHTNGLLVGAPAVEPIGARLRWGDVDGVRYNNEGQGVLSEYRVPLSCGEERLGVLRLGVAEPGFWTVVYDVADAAPLAILLPLASVVAGAFLLQRLVKPFSAVEDRLAELARTPHGQAVTLYPIDKRGAAAAGWNRIVDLTKTSNEGPSAESLETRLQDALSARRQAKSVEIVEGLRDGVAVTDAEGRIEFANSAVAALLNTGDDQPLAGAPLADALNRTAAGHSIELTPAATPIVAEIEAQAGGDDRVLRVERQPLDGRQGRAVWSIRDVTQQKLAEKSRDQFIDAATHELRTPLANIKAYAEILATSDLQDPEEQKEFYNTINSEATRLARFVDDLLDVSSMEVGSLSISRQNVEVERLLREAADKVAPLMEKKAQEFEVVLPPKMGEMQLDKDKISALLVNLLGNAAKYTPEGGSVRFKAEFTDTAFVIAVSDTGVGISEEEVPKVFDKFFRSEDPSVRNEAGTGLGLSLAREIARLHGGDVSVTSTLGEGSTFTITLPSTCRDGSTPAAEPVLAAGGV